MTSDATTLGASRTGRGSTLIQLTDEMKTAINNALDDGVPIIISSVDATGQPSISLRGSTQAFSDSQLAIWVRDPGGNFLKSIEANPKMALFYRNPEKRVGWLFHGEATRHDDGPTRDAVYAAAPERERNQDPEKAGTAVVIDLIRVIARGQVLMER